MVQRQKQWACLLLVLSLVCITALSSLSGEVWAVGADYMAQALVGGKQTQRWNDQTQVVYVSIKSGSHLQNWNPQHANAVKQAFSRWQQVLGNRFRFAYTNDPRLTDITVEWWQRAQGTEVGLQTLKWSNNIITEAKINIALWNPKGHVFNSQDIYGIALHEIGHCLGIRGHSDVATDIMYYSMDRRVNDLSDRDINTIRMLYARKPDITNPIGTHLLQYRYYEYYARLGAQALVNNNPNQAVKYFTTAQQYYSHDHRISMLLGLSSYGLGQYEKAVASLKPALSMPMNKEELATCEFFLAQSYLQLAKQAYKGGNTGSAAQQLASARYHFNRVVNNPSLPNEFRQTASKNHQILQSSGQTAFGLN
ncbi:MAG: matrixin family metalloprotease [Vampirovibrionales bacterium]